MFFNLFLYLFTRSAIQTAAKTQNIFILVRNSNMDGDMYNGFLFNWRYQSRAQSSPAPRSVVGCQGEVWGHEKNMIFLIGSQ